jgi:DNA-binding LytR/AlgR family response regulator
MNVIIVDDEPLALEILENYIFRTSQLKLVAKCRNALEAFEAIHKHQVDLMFLDIQMPQITGVDFLKTLSNPPQVIMTTAYANYAVEGFELNVTDYLLKPISFERFSKAVQKTTLNAQQGGNLSAQPNPNAALADPEAAQKLADKKNDFIFVKTDKKLVKLKFADIFFIEGLKDYVMIYSPTGRIITLQTLKSLEEKLPQDAFVRAHRSFIVNINHIDQIEANHITIHKKEIPIGKNFKDELQQLINTKRL